MWISDLRTSTNDIVIQRLSTWCYGTKIIGECTLYHNHKDKKEKGTF